MKAICPGLFFVGLAAGECGGKHCHNHCDSFCYAAALLEAPAFLPYS